MTIGVKRLFLILLIVFPVSSLAQTSSLDNPNLDNQFGVLPPEAFQPRVGPPVLNIITSADGYDNFDLGVDFAEPHAVANPLAPRQHFSAFNTNATHHTEDGHDWQANNPVFPGGAAGDPVAAYDSLGNLYYINMKNPITGAWVVRSTDNGTTWSSALTAVAGIDKCWIAADQTMGPFAGYAYAVMTSGAANQGNFGRTTNGGASWAQSWTFNTQALPGMMVAVGPDVLSGDIPGGCVYVVTNSGSSTASTYTFYRSTDGGSTFTQRSANIWANYVGTFVQGRNSVENSRTRPYPFIAADNSYGPYRGRLYCVYASNDPPGNGNKPDIWCRYSDDHGSTWSAAIRVNDDPNPTQNHQWTPAIWCDLVTGRLYAKWYDTRECAPLDDSTDVFASYSDDGGTTWAPNQKLTTEKFKIDCATCGGGGTPRYQGDYDAIVSNEHTSMAVWADFRNGTFMSTTAYFPDFAMLISESADTLETTGSKNVTVTIPGVKLYSNTAIFSASIEPAGNFTFDFPDGNVLTSYPDSLDVEISWSGVANGSYVVTIQGEGPNGTPVHRRSITLLLTSPYVDVTQPNGGEILYSGTTYPISWVDALVDTVKLEYSTDNGTIWTTIADSIQSRSGNPVPPKARVVNGLVDPSESVAGSYSWLVPFTASDQCLIRVSHYGDGGIVDVSDAAFTIIDPPAAVWRTQASPNTDDLFTVSVLDTSVAYASGAGGIVLRTLNGGNTWTATVGSAGADVYSIEAVSTTVVLVATYDSGTGTAKIRRTQTGGLSWTDVFTDSSPGAFINSIEMFDAQNGYAVGDPVSGQWTLLRTTTGGVNWLSAANLPQDGSEAGWNNSMSWTDPLHGWFGTNNSRVYFSTDGGSNWSFGNTTIVNSSGVDFEGNGTSGLAVGSDVDVSIDGGANWAPVSGGPGITASAISIVDVDNFIANRDPIAYVTAGGNIYKSDNLGSFLLDHTQANVYNHIEMTAVEAGGNNWLVGYAVGDGGTITKYTELLILTDVKQVSGLVPGEFALTQNYPNPFNPSTTIRYDLAGESAVTLEIYNVLGQLVRTLVSTTQNAGSYEAVWDGHNMSGAQAGSGVYFYRLEAASPTGGSFVNMKKMVMMK